MEPRTQPREHMLEANGLRHHVLEWGAPDARETVLLCHGFLDLAWGFSELATQLAEAGYRALALDFRGHGESAWVGPGSQYHFPEYVLDLHELAPQLIEGRFHLLGHSMGGTVSTMYAATHRERVLSLTLLEGLGPNAEPPERALARFETWLAQSAQARAPTLLTDLEHALAQLAARHPQVERAFLRLLAEKSTRPHPSGVGLSWRFDPRHRTLSPNRFDRERFVQCLARIEAPTLVVHGEHGMRSHDEAERLARLHDARRVMVPGAGHMLHWSHCARSAELVLEHLGRARP